MNSQGAYRPSSAGFTLHDVADGLRALASEVERGALRGRSHPQLAVEVPMQLADAESVVYAAERFGVTASRAVDKSGNLHTWVHIGFGTANYHPLRATWVRYPVVLSLVHIGPDGHNDAA